mmetsp:Transcript_34600/g.64095  ORF Transcript_34600/g.64095 Transcript_34600/m.64095 type:complete len:262 (-) Transcript_34600:340-1125(-)
MDLQSSYGNDILVVPVIWPFHNASFTEGLTHITDRRQATMAAEALRIFFFKMEAYCESDETVKETLSFNTHLCTHSIGSWILSKMAEGMTEYLQSRQLAFKFGVVTLVQALVTAKLFTLCSQEFYQAGFNILALSQSTVVTHTEKDETLRQFLNKQKSARRLFGKQCLGQVGPGNNVAHNKNFHVYNAEMILEKSSSYHLYVKMSPFVELMKLLIRKSNTRRTERTSGGDEGCVEAGSSDSPEMSRASGSTCEEKDRLQIR